MTKPRALIVGGSVGGLFAAHLLLAAGWDIEIFERSGDVLAGRGAGIGTRPELFEILAQIGITLEASAGVALGTRACLGDDGGVRHVIPWPAAPSAWDRVYRPLRAALPEGIYRSGRSLAAVEQDDTGVTAVFADGSRVAGDLLVAADGMQSTARRQFLPEVQPRYAGYVAWRGVVEEHDIPAAFQAVLFAHQCFCLPEGELVLSQPIPGRDDDVRPGHRRYYFIWFRPVAEAAVADLCTDAAGRRHGVSIPPPLIRPELVAAMKADARAGLPPPLAAIVSMTAQPLLQPIFDFETPRMVWGRVVLVGDAAFVARPHVATGVTKAALDAACLADRLAEGGGLAASLARYEEARLVAGRGLVARSRMLGAYLEDTARPRPSRDPDQVMREYGAAAAL